PRFARTGNRRYGRLSQRTVSRAAARGPSDKRHQGGSPNMANFTAADGKKLRELTGSGMKACKDALVETAGDLDKAVDVLRVKGAKDVGKRAERTAAEGLIAVSGNTMVEVNSETDFVAKNSEFIEFANKVAEAAAKVKANSQEE